MTFHHWGDKGVDWAGINDAAEYIGTSLERWGVCVHQYKEKFGTIRVYCDVNTPREERVYRWFYARALLKWPHLREEILCCADYSRLLADL